MGVPLNVAENIDKRVNYHHPIPKGPLSWGISNMALTKNKMNNKVLLKYVKLCYIIDECSKLFLFQRQQKIAICRIY